MLNGSSRSNHPSLADIRHMAIGDIIALPAAHLALLQAEARDAFDSAKRMQDWIEGAIALRFEQRASAARASAGKDTGTVRFQDENVEIVADLPKKVEWDQARLAALMAQIRAGGEDPAEYVETALKVSERAYAAWPERIRTAFEPARTVRTGRPSFKLALLSDSARRDSPQAGAPALLGGNS